MSAGDWPCCLQACAGRKWPTAQAALKHRQIEHGWLDWSIEYLGDRTEVVGVTRPGKGSGVRVVGLDLSLTATGVADSDGTAGVIKPRIKGHDRLDFINDAIAQHVTGDPAAGLVLVEGPSFGSQGSAYHQLAGLWWLVVHGLWKAEIPYAVVSPQARAKYATGRGNAGKDAVLASVVRRYPMVEINDNNVADAWVLMAMGLDWLGRPLCSVPAVNREALAKVEWPAGLIAGAA